MYWNHTCTPQHTSLKVWNIPQICLFIPLCTSSKSNISSLSVLHISGAQSAYTSGLCRLLRFRTHSIEVLNLKWPNASTQNVLFYRLWLFNYKSPSYSYAQGDVKRWRLVNLIFQPSILFIPASGQNHETIYEASPDYNFKLRTETRDRVLSVLQYSIHLGKS